MTIKNMIIASLTVLMLGSLPAQCLAYNMMEADELKARLEKSKPGLKVDINRTDVFRLLLDMQKPLILIDIQPINSHNEHHFPGSIKTLAYPAKTETETNTLAQVFRIYQSTGKEVVIIGPRGGKAEQRAADYLIKRGIPAEKLHILKGGIRAWPHRDMLLNIKGGCS